MLESSARSCVTDESPRAKLGIGEDDTAKNYGALMGLRHGVGCGNWLRWLYFAFLLVQRTGFAGTVNAIVVSGLMIAIIDLSYGFTNRALPPKGGGVALALGTLGRTNALLAG